MVGLTLLSEARAAGLIVSADGDRLVVRGPRSADAVARLLLANKAAVMAALAEKVTVQTPVIESAADVTGMAVLEAVVNELLTRMESGLPLEGLPPLPDDLKLAVARLFRDRQ